MGEERECSLEPVVKFFAQKWTLYILLQLCINGPLRFNDLQKKVGTISPKTLTMRLRELEEKKFIMRTQYNETPPRVEYSLAKKGEEFGKIFSDLAKASKNWDE